MTLFPACACPITLLNHQVVDKNLSNDDTSTLTHIVQIHCYVKVEAYQIQMLFKIAQNCRCFHCRAIAVHFQFSIVTDVFPN